MSLSITLPNRAGSRDNEQIDFPGHVVIVGANGSGKTRLGVWIEEQQKEPYKAHRISAQKALAIPDYAQLKTLEQAEKDLAFGRSDEHASAERKTHDRWGNNPATFLLSDFDKVISLLFAKEIERDRKHAEQTRQSGIYVPVQDSPIDTIIKVWSDIMPQREIKFLDGKVLVSTTNEQEYHGKGMSDGERVALYLMAQCLCTRDNSLIIVDEPEIHLHKAIVNKLWNKVEELCPTKTIIYITHDLDFAASRVDASKIWLQSYSGTKSWIWAEVPKDDSLPESLILEVLGSRKKILFCEGDAGSLDTTIYQLAYPDYHVIPRGGCENVIESTKALRNNQAFHHTNAVGLVDTDYRSVEEISALSSHGIHTIEVAEIENVFCVESAVRIVADHLELDPNLVVAEVTRYIRKALKKELELQISSMAEKRIQYLLRAFSKESDNKQGLTNGLKTTLDRIDIEAIYAECQSAFDTAIASNSLNDLLRVYNRKSLPTQISGILKQQNGEYAKLLVRLMKGEKQQSIISALKEYIPSLP